MKKKICFLSAIFFISFFLNKSSAQSPYGVWLYNTDTTNNFNNLKSSNPFLTGVMVSFKWSEIDTGVSTNHKYTWTYFDKLINKITNAGLNAEVMVWAGPSCPDWVYSTVDSFKTDDNTFSKYPYYFDADYKPLWYSMIKSVLNHIDTLAPSHRDKILIYQSTEGTTGDLDYYKGKPLNPMYNITGAQWAGFVEDAWHYTDSLIGTESNLTNIHLLVNTGGAGQVFTGAGIETVPGVFQWANTNIPTAWRKATNMGHFYQTNYERPYKDSFNALINIPGIGGNPNIRCRDELDFHQNALFFNKYKGWNSFYTAANGLDFGLDIWCVTINALTAFPDALRFFSKYAGYKDTAASPEAFCVLRDGLDAADSTRFPVSTFGGGNSNKDSGEARAKAIANSFSAYGAHQDQPSTAQGNAINELNNTLKDSLNDANWWIHRGNYERYLHQIDTSSAISFWRVQADANDTASTYGRFAKGFQALGTQRHTLF